jgi:hypothetical protein
VNIRPIDTADLPARGGSVSGKVAKMLRESPGKHFLIEGTSLVVTDFNKGSVRAFQPEGAFTARRIDGKLYASYVGE